VAAFTFLAAASGLLDKFCTKFETCQWFFRWNFKRDFNVTNGCIVFNLMHYLSNRPLGDSRLFGSDKIFSNRAVGNRTRPGERKI
jgi:hypothetical protein